MDTSDLVQRITELELTERNEDFKFGKVLPVKVRVRCGDRVQVFDLEPGMLSAKNQGSEPAVVLIDLS